MIRAGSRRGAGRRWWRVGALALVGAAAGAGAWIGLGGPGWPGRAVLRDSGPSTPLAFSPDGGTLATLGPGGIALWDAAKGRRLEGWKVDDGWLAGRPAVPAVLGAGFTPDGAELIVLQAGGDGGRKVSIDRVDSASGMVRATAEAGFELAGPGLFALTIDGKRFRMVGRDPASGALATVDFDVPNARILPPRPISPPAGSNLLAISPDTRYLAFAPAVGPEVGLWGLDEDRPAILLRAEGAAPARSAAFSGDGSALAIGRADGPIEVWDVVRGSRRATWSVHSPGIAPGVLRFTYVGSTLASAGDRAGSDGETVAFDARNGHVIGRAPGEGDPALDPNFEALATASRKDGTVRLRRLPGKPDDPWSFGRRFNPF